mmetsp:Transcript_33414/g.32870  ORF Transcript_33414/g.32870 Transcript_33414/m.32870 type:complete len:269 (-) Transcript_33414:1216-2022(-)
MKASEAEEIFLAKSTDITSQSFGTYLETSSVQSQENSRDSKQNDEGSDNDNRSDQEKYDPSGSDEETIKMIEGSMPGNLMPQMNIFEEKQKESVSLTPKLIKSLMHRKVIKISSGGVHNICIVEPYPNHLSGTLYSCLMKSKFTDVTFIIREKHSSFASTQEDEKQADTEETKSEFQILRGKSKLRKGYTEYKVSAHKFVLASRSAVFSDMFKKNTTKNILIEKKDSGLSGDSSSDVIVIKDTTFKAFKVLLDYIYLDNLSLLDDING